MRGRSLANSRHVLNVVALASASLTVAAQQTPPRFSTDASLVRVDVSVLDKNRQPVRGLIASDFVVTEDGRTQPITAFTEVNLPAPASASAAWANEAPADVERNDKTTDHRLLVLVLDDAMAPSDAMVANSTREVARKVIDQLGPGDLAAVTYTGDGRSAQGFTQDRGRLRAAIDAFAPGLHQLSNLFSPDQQVVNAEKARALSVTNTLRLLVQALATIPDRRKAIVLVSVGAAVDADSAASTHPSDPTPQVYTLMKEIVRQAQQASVNIYSIDPAGLDGMRLLLERQVPASRFEVEARDYADRVEVLSRAFRDFSRVFADNTGGKALFNTNEFNTGVMQIMRETGSFYLLGYSPQNRNDDGRFRRIQVRVNKPGMTVNSRRGYYAPDPPQGRAKLPSPPPALVSAIAGLLPQADLPLQASAAPFAVPGEREAAIVVTSGVRRPLGPASADMDRVRTAVTAFSLEGEVRGTAQFEASLPAGGGAGGEINYETVGALRLGPGRYQLRISVESSLANATGSVYYDTEVPNFNSAPVALSGVLLFVSPPLPTAVAENLPSVPLSPTTRRSFAMTDKVSAFVRLYQGGQASLRVISANALILDASGAIVFDLPRTFGTHEFATGRSADYAIDLPLTLLKSGPHLLRIQVAAGSLTARQQLPFAVR